jgi:hypothetical protein
MAAQISTLPGLFQSGAQASKLTFKPAPLLLDSQGRQIDETGKVSVPCCVALQFVQLRCNVRCCGRCVEQGACACMRFVQSFDIIFATGARH